MQSWIAIALIVIGALVLVSLIIGSVFMYQSYMNPYSTRNITIVVKDAYKETGKDPANIDVLAVAEVQKVDKEGYSIYDVRIHYIEGDLKGETLDFRYHFFMTKEKVLTVHTADEAPEDSPLTKL